MRRQVQGDAQRCIIFRMENVDLMGHINDQGDLLLQHSELDTLLRQTSTELCLDPTRNLDFTPC